MATDKWYFRKNDPYHKLGHVYNRNGKAYTRVRKGSLRESTGMPFANQFKDQCLELLRDRIDQSLKSDKLEINTLFELIEYYVENIVKQHRRYEYLKAFKRLIVKDCTLDDIDGIRKMIIENINNSKYSLSTIHLSVILINSMFVFALNEGFIRRNPILKSIIPEKPKATKKIFTDEELDLIESNIKLKSSSGKYFAYKLRLLYAIKLCRNTGMRIQEIVNLSWSDISDIAIKIHGKGNRIRYYPIGPFPELVALVEEMKDILRPEFGIGKVFGEKYMMHAQIINFFTKELRMHNLYEPGKAFHAIRRLHEQKLIYDNRLDPYLTAQLLGHSVMIQYKHYVEELGVEKLNELLKEREKNPSNVLTLKLY
jgi:integrase